MIGTTLGHYRIVEQIGAGGMGVVYRAHDERLDRDVAIKVLPATVAQDPERIARFEREAKLLASLNHPNIATLYGLEEHEGQRFLVMELAEGETLAERLKKGPIPVDDALPVVLQIAEGLEAAHERGIIHRDLKPANVMLSAEGKVKVLDFGLAKAWQFEESDADITHSPTLTGQMTAAGVLLGTAAYMSPEQARGRAADKRADIWAFGVILFEMLTGTRLFEGETTSDVLAAVLRAEPDWSKLPAETPRPIGRLLRRCLERDPKERLHDIADARLEIEEAIALPNWPSTDQMERPELTILEKVRAAWPMLLVGAAVSALLSAAVWWLAGNRLGPAGQLTRVTLNLPPGITADATIPGGVRPQLAISPGGRWLVFVGAENGTPRLFKRSLDEFEAVPIPGTEGGFHPFFSPDRDWVGFFADEKLKKIPLDGGPPQVLADAPNPWGATWGPDGTIVYNRRDGDGLWRVSATGGAPEQLISAESERGDFDLVWPEFLPDGNAVLFTCIMGLTADIARIEVLDLKSRARKTLVEDASYARYVPTGHLVFGRQGRAEVAPFDAKRREITGPSVPVSESIFYEMESGALNLSFSADGTLAFIPGGGVQTRQLLSVDLEGVERPLVSAWRGFMYPTFSPDGERLAVTISEPGDTNIWVIDLATGAQTKLTREGVNVFPSWTPDGERVTYLSSRGGYESSIDWKRADGSGESEPLIATAEKGEVLGPGSWSPDGETLVFIRYLSSQPENGFDIWVAAGEDDRKPRPFGVTRTSGIGPAVSPDGKWLAYTSEESGQSEIYVQPFPDGGERYQISTDGGRKPVWSPDGRSINYRALDERRILAAPVTTKPRFRAGIPTVLLNGPYETGTYYWSPNFDISPDGRSFVMVKPDEKWGKASEIRIVLNWFEELKRLAPTE